MKKERAKVFMHGENWIPEAKAKQQIAELVGLLERHHKSFTHVLFMAHGQHEALRIETEEAIKRNKGG